MKRKHETRSFPEPTLTKSADQRMVVQRDNARYPCYRDEPDGTGRGSNPLGDAPTPTMYRF